MSKDKMICPMCKTVINDGIEEKIEEKNRFQKSENGVITDTDTTLQWYVGPDRDTTWDEAKSWVDNLDVDGGGWRMPTRMELIGLYEEGKGIKNIDPIFKTTSWWVWSGELHGSSSAWAVCFYRGSGYYYYRSYSRYYRAFAARSAR